MKAETIRQIRAALDAVVEDADVAATDARDALDEGRFSAARGKVEKVEALESLARVLRRFLDAWEAAAADTADPGDRADRPAPPPKTPKEKFRIPILQALAEMGGTARATDVLDRVAEIMRPTLSELDLEPYPSNPDAPRWRNTAHWERLAMIDEDLLQADSPRGTWEATDEGMRLYERRAKRG